MKPIWQQHFCLYALQFYKFFPRQNWEGKCKCQGESCGFFSGGSWTKCSEVCAGATKSRIFLCLWEKSHGNVGRDWYLQALVTHQPDPPTLQAAGGVFNLGFEMWVKPVDKMIPHEQLLLVRLLLGHCPFVLREDSVRRLETAEGWWSCHVLPSEPEEVLRVLHSTRDSWIQAEPQALPRCVGDSSQPGIVPSELSQHFYSVCAGGTGHLPPVRL